MIDRDELKIELFERGIDLNIFSTGQIVTFELVDRRKNRPIIAVSDSTEEKVLAQIFRKLADTKFQAIKPREGLSIL